MESEQRVALGSVRERTFALVAHLDDAQLARSFSPIMSPLAWDLGHVAAYEDLWIAHRTGGLELLRPGLAELYDAFETPRTVRAGLEFLRGAELREYMQAVRERTLATADGATERVELVLRHELQHTETMLQAMALAGLQPPGFAGPAPVGGDGLELVEVPAGPVE